ncbi:MAG: Gfo/Idh/MocA family oxidoreductase, partial [Spirochaetota bacterium]
FTGPQLVVITTPNTTHVTYVKATLEAGKHVLVEKPFGVSAGDGRDIFTLAQKMKRTAERYDARFSRMGQQTGD